jgi:hypothetical protein
MVGKKLKKISSAIHVKQIYKSSYKSILYILLQGLCLSICLEEDQQQTLLN